MVQTSRTKLAFTLVELVLTIFLIAILFLTGIPRFFSTVAFSKRLFAQQVLSNISYAQTLAIGAGCHISVSVTATTITLNLRASCTSGTFSLPVYDPNNVSSSLVDTAPANVTISNTNFPIYFDITGQAYSVSSGNTVNATLTINDTVISITGATGIISSG